MGETEGLIPGYDFVYTQNVNSSDRIIKPQPPSTAPPPPANHPTSIDNSLNIITRTRNEEEEKHSKLIYNILI